MQVILKRNFCTKLGRFRSKGRTPVEIPDSLSNHLPRDAVVVSKKRVGRPKKPQEQFQEHNVDIQ